MPMQKKTEWTFGCSVQRTQNLTVTLPIHNIDPTRDLNGNFLICFCIVIEEFVYRVVRLTIFSIIFDLVSHHIRFSRASCDSSSFSFSMCRNSCSSTWCYFLSASHFTNPHPRPRSLHPYPCVFTKSVPDRRGALVCILVIKYLLQQFLYITEHKRHKINATSCGTQ